MVTGLPPHFLDKKIHPLISYKKNRKIKMRDFVSSIHTHSYVEDLERRIAILEARLEATERVADEPIDLDTIETLPKTRNEYMRNYMAEKRRREREKVSV